MTNGGWFGISFVFKLQVNMHIQVKSDLTLGAECKTGEWCCGFGTFGKNVRVGGEEKVHWLLRTVFRINGLYIEEFGGQKF